MEHSKLQSPNHLMTIELSSELYTALLKQVKTTGKTETELVVEGLRQVLSQPDDKNTEKDRLAILEANLEKKLKQYVDSLIKDRQSNVAANPEISDRKSLERVLPIPTIRPLDLLQN
jgi:hypothetical protein